MALGPKLTALRLKRGDTLQKVADGVGISKAHMWELEKGRSSNPSIELVKRLADYFGQDVSFFLNAEKPKISELEEAKLYYRDLKSLKKEDRDLILANIRMLKARADTSR